MQSLSRRSWTLNLFEDSLFLFCNRRSLESPRIRSLAGAVRAGRKKNSFRDFFLTKRSWYAEAPGKKLWKNRVFPLKAITRRRGKRKPLPPELPREEITHDLPGEEKYCSCGHEKVVIGRKA